jgi:hypothetical protein
MASRESSNGSDLVMANGITVVDVIRALGFEPEPELTWAVGNRMRDWFEKEYGLRPTKELRTKTVGIGSYCFAIYPPSLWDVIAGIVREYQAELSRQLELFQ